MNGVGPQWFPASLRQALTRLSAMFFNTASWDRHDQGYQAGSPSRSKCDHLFLAAMLADGSQAGPVWRMLGCSLLAWTFWLSARAMGWTTYNYS
jgi:hypothetical protein